VVTNGLPARRAAIMALQAGARLRAWTRSTPSVSIIRRISLAFQSSLTGFLVAAAKGTNSPPAAEMRGANRPPSDNTSARPPARTMASAISTADSSAPPVSSSGMICSMVGRLSAKRVSDREHVSGLPSFYSMRAS
jgi:hypothetical protein